MITLYRLVFVKRMDKVIAILVVYIENVVLLGWAFFSPSFMCVVSVVVKAIFHLAAPLHRFQERRGLLLDNEKNGEREREMEKCPHGWVGPKWAFPTRLQ